jgi:DNA-binding CsgD family transcriptional regulator
LEQPTPNKELALADLIGDLLNVAYDDGHLNQWLEKCAKQLGCSKAALLSWESGNPDSPHSLNYGAESLVRPEWCEWFNQLMQLYIPENPCLLEDIMMELFNASEKATDGSIARLISIAPGLSGNTKIALVAWRRDIVILILEHAEEDGWTLHDAERIRFIAQHLASASQLLSHVYNCRWGLAKASTIMASAPSGLSVLGQHGHVGYATSKAKIVLEMNDGLAIKNGKLSFADKLLEKEFYENFYRLEGQDRGVYNVSVQRDSGKPPFQLMLAAMKTDFVTAKNIQGEPFLALFVNNPSDQVKLSTHQLQQYFNFTKAEAKVARAVFAEDTLQDAAGSLNISINTLRTHLRRVYEKAKVGSQSELMRALSSTLQTNRVNDENIPAPMFNARKATIGSTWRNDK